MKSSNVNQAMARDLVSNANSNVANLRDFEERLLSEQKNKQDAAQFEYGRTLLENQYKMAEPEKPREEDLRSLRSEYDYGSKKKFVDVLGNINTTSSQINELRRLHEQGQLKQGSVRGSVKASIPALSHRSLQSDISLESRMTEKIAALRKER